MGGGDGIQLGRFSRKAQVSSLLQQVVEAYHEDMGITSDFLPEENSHAQAGGVALGDQVPDPEISAATVLTTVMYVRLLAPPKRGPSRPKSSAARPCSIRLSAILATRPPCARGPVRWLP